MSNPLYEQYKGAPMPQQNGQQMGQPQKPNAMQAFQQFKANPAQAFQQMGWNIPQNIMNDPNAIWQHLMNSGRIPQNYFTQVMQMLGNRRG